MKLKEIKLTEGLVDIQVLGVIQQVAQNGITNGAQTVALARSIMAISSGQVMMADNFNEFYNTFFPKKELTDSLEALSKGDAQRIANYCLQFLNVKDTQIAMPICPFRNVEDLLYYATVGEAND